jgi:hypothetical protein
VNSGAPGAPLILNDYKMVIQHFVGLGVPPALKRVFRLLDIVFTSLQKKYYPVQNKFWTAHPMIDICNVVLLKGRMEKRLRKRRKL